MKATPPKILRCAVYTRVSTDQGLEQDFNSLDAQRESGESFIKSQAHEGWRLIPTSYDDGGYSGGSLERPALQRLLEDVKARLVDVILVYKIDRLTRSLADFAKLVELFDANGVSFTSITQAFNTSTSMGRLTLNVLLSFAQFEREVTGERIRDKIAASKKKGIWMGGVVPLGYRVEDRKLLIEPKEAETVRMIFERYLALGSMPPLLTELYETGIRTRVRTQSNGTTIGGVPFTKGPLAHLLKNRMYLGEINHRNQSYAGQHPPILERAIFEAVQAKLAANQQKMRKTRGASNALLLGKLFDDRGNLMTPTHTLKKGRRYDYYISSALLDGRKSEVGTITRVHASQIEAAVIDALRASSEEAAITNGYIENSPRKDGQALITNQVDKVVIEKGQLRITQSSDIESSGTSEVIFPWSPTSNVVKRDVISPRNSEKTTTPPQDAKTRAILLKSIAQGRAWLEELVSDDKASPTLIATRVRRSKRSVNTTISLAFLANHIIEAAMQGILPRDVNMTRLTDLPISWAKQRQLLCLSK